MDFGWQYEPNQSHKKLSKKIVAGNVRNWFSTSKTDLMFFFELRKSCNNLFCISKNGILMTKLQTCGVSWKDSLFDRFDFSEIMKNINAVIAGSELISFDLLCIRVVQNYENQPSNALLETKSAPFHCCSAPMFFSSGTSGFRRNRANSVLIFSESALMLTHVDESTTIR